MVKKQKALREERLALMKKKVRTLIATGFYDFPVFISNKTVSTGTSAFTKSTDGLSEVCFFVLIILYFEAARNIVFIGFS